MDVLIVISHPRKNSLTHAFAREFIKGLEEAGHKAEVLDLYREKFDPILIEDDEPDWSNPGKVYSPTVESEMERLKRNDALAVIFPVWWYSLPAMAKGWVDRVWNHGFAYGENKDLMLSKVLWIGLAGLSEHQYEKRNYHRLLEHQLNIGIAEYCGIHDSSVELIYDTIDGYEGQNKTEISRKVKADFNYIYQLGKRF